MLAGKQGLARVSPTPGFTKLINFFTMSKRWRLVDLPGYGFAHVAREDSARFNEAVNDYLEHRKNLCLVFALIDSSLPPQKIDLEFVGWLTSKRVPYVLVFTKTDTATPAKVQTNIAAFTDSISGWFEKPPEILSCSAKSEHGRRELLAVIEKSLTVSQGEKQIEVEPPRQDAVLPPEDLPAQAWPVRATATHKKTFSRKRPW